MLLTNLFLNVLLCFGYLILIFIYTTVISSFSILRSSKYSKIVMIISSFLSFFLFQSVPRSLHLLGFLILLQFQGTLINVIPKEISKIVSEWFQCYFGMGPNCLPCWCIFSPIYKPQQDGKNCRMDSVWMEVFPGSQGPKSTKIPYFHL